MEDITRGTEGPSSGQVYVPLLFGQILTLSLPPTRSGYEHLGPRGCLAAAGTNASDYCHQMTLMAGHPAPYGDLRCTRRGAAGSPHLHDYLNPVDGEC